MFAKQSHPFHPCGQPSFGFFFRNDFLMASCHVPLIASRSSFGPRFCPGGFFLRSFAGRMSGIRQPFTSRAFDGSGNALPIIQGAGVPAEIKFANVTVQMLFADTMIDRKSTRLNSSHSQISYAV